MAANSSTIIYDAALVERITGYFQQFMPLEARDVKELMPYCEFRQFEKRTLIIKEGEIDNYLNLVINGLVMKYLKVKRNEVILQLATEGHVVSAEISYLSRIPSLVYLETLEPTLMVSMRYDKMQEALENYSRGEELGRKILENMYIRKDERKFMWQSMGVRERFLHYIQHHPHMLQRVPQKYLASYLNIKAETFSRLKHLTRKK
jgi:CRP-like cAMP-binding protein